MNKSQQLLSDIVVYNKYAKYLPKLKRRETWEEIVERYVQMLTSKYKDNKDLVEEIRKNSTLLFSKDVLPSMRALQFSGPAIQKNESRVYNCSYLPVDNYLAFSEIMFLLLGGTGKIVKNTLNIWKLHGLLVSL